MMGLLGLLGLLVTVGASYLLTIGHWFLALLLVAGYLFYLWELVP